MALKPSNWTIASFDKIITIVSAPNKIQSKQFLEDGLYPIISQEQELISGYWNDSLDVIKVTTPLIIFGDHTKVVKIIDFDFVQGADGIKILKPSNSVDSKFLYYAICNSSIRDLGYARHFKLLKQLKFLFPPLEEQKEIVKILDSAFARLDNALESCQKALVLADELWKAYLDKALAFNGNSPLHILFQVAEIIAGQSPEGKFYNAEKNGLEFHQGKKEFTDKYLGISNTWTSKITKIAKKNDIVMSVRAPVGPINIVIQDEICVGRGLTIIRPNEYIKLEFLYYHLQYFQPYLKGTSGTVFDSINKTQIEQIPLYLPPLEEQKEIVAKLDKINDSIQKLKSDYTQKINSIKELKASLLDKAFRGELIK